MTLAILAGRGALPGVLLEAEPAIVVRFRGVEVALDGPMIEARFEQLGKLFTDLNRAGVTEVCLAGAMSRPVFDPVAFDPLTAKLLPRLTAAMGKGDDALLRDIMAVIEEAGFAIRGAHEVRPDLVAAVGPLAGDPVGDLDAARGRAVLAALGPLDVGQAAVVAGGQVIGVETLQGTDAMLDFVARTAPGTGGVLVKRPKRGQDLRVDMPAIGPDTVRGAARAGLKGIEIAAGTVLLLDRAAVLAACAECGVSLWAAP